MRIALVADRVGSLAETAEADVVAAPLAGALAALGHRVSLYACELGIDAPPGVQVTRLRGSCTRLEDRLLRESSALLAERWSAERPTVVHAMTWTAGLTALAAFRDITAGPSIPLVQTFDGLARPDTGDGVGRVRLE